MPVGGVDAVIGGWIGGIGGGFWLLFLKKRMMTMTGIIKAINQRNRNGLSVFSSAVVFSGTDGVSGIGVISGVSSMIDMTCGVGVRKMFVELSASFFVVDVTATVFFWMVSIFLQTSGSDEYIWSLSLTLHSSVKRPAFV